MKSLTAFAALAIAAICCPDAAVFAQTSADVEALLARIERDVRPAADPRGSPISLEAYMQRLHVQGVSIAVVDSGRIAWTKTYGWADVDGKRRVTPDTRFQAAAMSTPVASTAALRLVEQGRLSLDKDINLALKSWRLPANELTAKTPVTLRMLLTHMGGFTLTGFPGYASGAAIPTVPQILEGVPPANTTAVRVGLEPGTKWRYSGGGVTIAQLLMTDVTGESFATLVRRLVLDPAGMKSSGYEQPLPDSLASLAAVGYDDNGVALNGRWRTYPVLMDSGMWTTASDLARYIIEMQRAYAGHSQMITQATAQAMLTPGPGPSPGWGLGIEMSGAGNSLRFGHAGANAGYRGHFVGWVTGGRGIVVLTNGNNGAQVANAIILSIAREYDWPGLGSRR
jgi:CubicO group peptidase (beta-lactamase class C family)